MSVRLDILRQNRAELKDRFAILCAAALSADPGVVGGKRLEQIGETARALVAVDKACVALERLESMSIHDVIAMAERVAA